MARAVVERETLERLLVTFDFGEALVALNLCVKPALDEAVVALARAAKKSGDQLKAKRYERYADYADERTVRKQQAKDGLSIVGKVGAVELLGVG